MKAAALACVAALIAGAAHGAGPALQAAEQALSEAAPRARIAALTAALSAQEAALADAREALRAASDSQAAMRKALAARDGAAFRALAALQRLDTAPPLAWALHPAGPVAAARAAMMVLDAAPVLAEKARVTRAAVQAQVAQAERGAAATARLRDALGALQALRAALALGGASGKTPQDLADLEGAAAAAVAALAQDVTALAALSGPRAAARKDRGAATHEERGAAARKERGAAAPYPPPVEAWLRVAAASDGGELALEVPAYARVLAPATVTVRHVGKAGGEGLTMVLEPQRGVLIVLRGLASASRAAGDTALAGEPLGALGGPPPAADEFLIDATATKGTIPPATLYIEVMRGGEPDDPAAWFALTAERTGE